jgi:hypothetical protein
MKTFKDLMIKLEIERKDLVNCAYIDLLSQGGVKEERNEN